MTKEKSKESFRNMDRPIFIKVDQFKNGSTYQKIIESLSLLDNDLKKFFIELFSLTITLVPIFVFLFFFWGNLSRRWDLDSKTKTLEMAYNYLSGHKNIQQFTRTAFSSQSYNDSYSFEKKIFQYARSHGLIEEHLNFSNFSSKPINDYVNESKITARFTEVSHYQLFQTLSSLSRFDKIKILSLAIQREDIGKTLSATVELLHLGPQNTNR